MVCEWDYGICIVAIVVMSQQQKMTLRNSTNVFDLYMYDEAEKKPGILNPLYSGTPKWILWQTVKIQMKCST